MQVYKMRIHCRRAYKGSCSTAQRDGPRRQRRLWLLLLLLLLDQVFPGERGLLARRRHPEKKFLDSRSKKCLDPVSSRRSSAKMPPDPNNHPSWRNAMANNNSCKCSKFPSSVFPPHFLSKFLKRSGPLGTTKNTEAQRGRPRLMKLRPTPPSPPQRRERPAGASGP